MITKGNMIIALFLVGGVIISPVCASAQLPEALSLQFYFDGTGNAILNQLPVYAGLIYAGDPLVLGADWLIRIDDSTWPPTSDPQARWDYLFNNFATYDPVDYEWTIVFDEQSCGEKPEWQINHSTNGTMTGTLVVAMTFGDNDMDGILDVEDRLFVGYSGNMIVMKYGTGNFASYCGEGTFNGLLQNSDPANWADDYVDGACLLILQACKVGTAIKELYR
jgi:hypothetical protein